MSTKLYAEHTDVLTGEAFAKAIASLNYQLQEDSATVKDTKMLHVGERVLILVTAEVGKSAASVPVDQSTVSVVLDAAEVTEVTL